MPRNYYGGAPNAFAGGAMFQKDVRTREHQDNALNALIERFGPEAGNPTAWGQVQSIDQSNQMFPHQLAEMEHRKRLRPYEIKTQEHLEALRPHQLGAAQRETDAYGALTQQYGPIAGNPGAQGIHNTENERLRGAALNAARWLQTTKAKGGDLGMAYDRISQILPHIGIPAEGVAAIREQIISDPDSVDELVAMLSGMEGGSNRATSGGQPMYDAEGNLKWVIPMADGSVQEVQGYTPATADQADRRLGQGDARLELQDRQVTLAEARAEGWEAEPGHRIYEDAETGEWYQRPMRGTPAEREVEDRDRRLTAEEHAARNAAQEQVTIADLALSSLDNTLAQMENWGRMQGAENNWSSGLRAFQGLPGIRSVTDVGRFMEEIETLKAHVAIDRLRSIKATGATLGQITERELTLLENSMGNLSSPSRQPALLRKDLEKIRDILTEARARAESALQMELRYPSGGGQSGARGAGGSPPPADADFEDLLNSYLGGGG